MLRKLWTWMVTGNSIPRLMITPFPWDSQLTAWIVTTETTASSSSDAGDSSTYRPLLWEMHYLDSLCSRVGLAHKQTQPRIKSHRNNYERFVSLSNLASAYYYNCSSSSSRCTFKHWQLPEWWTPSHLPWRRSTVVQGHCPALNVEPKINYATWLYCVDRMNGW